MVLASVGLLGALYWHWASPHPLVSARKAGTPVHLVSSAAEFIASETGAGGVAVPGATCCAVPDDRVMDGLVEFVQGARHV